MRNIDPDKHLLQPFSTQQPTLPTDKPVVQYVRVSTGTQVKNSVQSKIRQDRMLEGRLKTYGFTDIIQISTDMGKSGQKSRFERKGLDELYTLLESGKAAAVAAYDASRFFRDLTFTLFPEFMNFCKTQHIPIILYDHIFFLERETDEDALREEFKQAAFYLRHVHKVNSAKLQAIEDGHSYGGGCIPMGYYITGEKGARQFIIYQPHAQIIQKLFKRYRELGGSIPRLGRELPLYFPAFQDVPVPYVALPLTPDGYGLSTRGALISILTNPAYIGMYVYNGVVVHNDIPPIVDRDTFLYAYNRLSPINLDGTENTNKPAVNRRHQLTPALLEGILTNNQYPMYVMANNSSYTAKNYGGSWDSTELVVSLDTIDHEVTAQVLYVLMVLESNKRHGVTSALQDKMATFQSSQAQEQSKLQESLKNTNKGIREWQLQKKVALQQEYEPGVAEAIANIKKLEREKTLIEDRIRFAETQRAQVQESYSLLETAAAQWQAWSFQSKQQFVRLILQRANIEAISPHLLKLTLVFNAPIDTTITGYLWRQKGEKSVWQDSDNATLQHLYPTADRKAILQALPERTWIAITIQARLLGVSRPYMYNNSGLENTIAYADVTACENNGVYLEAVRKLTYWQYEEEFEPTLYKVMQEDLHSYSEREEEASSNTIQPQKGLASLDLPWDA